MSDAIDPVLTVPHRPLVIYAPVTETFAVTINGRSQYLLPGEHVYVCRDDGTLAHAPSCCVSAAHE